MIRRPPRSTRQLNRRQRQMCIRDSYYTKYNSTDKLDDPLNMDAEPYEKNMLLVYRYKRCHYKLKFFGSRDADTALAEEDHPYSENIRNASYNNEVKVVSLKANDPKHNLPYQWEFRGQTITRPTYLPEDYVFKGWALDAGGTQPLIPSGFTKEEQKNLTPIGMPEGGLALYPIWGPSEVKHLSLIHISEPTRHSAISRMPSSA